MNRVDRQNIAAINRNLQNGEPISFDTTTGTSTAAGMAAQPAPVDNEWGTVPDEGMVDNTVSNNLHPGDVLSVKPGTKYATCPEDEDFGTMPINEYGDFVENDATVPNTNRPGDVLSVKPGTKYATCPEDEWGLDPIGTQAEGDYAIGSVDDATVPNTNRPGDVLSVKPGTKYAYMCPEDFGTMPMDEHGDFVEEDATVPNTNRPGDVLSVKPGTKYAC